MGSEKTNASLEEITKKLLALGLTKDQMQDLIGVLALSNNRLIKIENIFIEWAVKLENKILKIYRNCSKTKQIINKNSLLLCCE